MKEYTDLKNRTHPVIETIREWDDAQETGEQQEREIMEALFRIFQTESETA